MWQRLSRRQGGWKSIGQTYAENHVPRSGRECLKDS